MVIWNEEAEMKYFTPALYQRFNSEDLDLNSRQLVALICGELFLICRQRFTRDGQSRCVSSNAPANAGTIHTYLSERIVG